MFKGKIRNVLVGNCDIMWISGLSDSLCIHIWEEHCASDLHNGKMFVAVYGFLHHRCQSVLILWAHKGGCVRGKKHKGSTK